MERCINEKIYADRSTLRATIIAFETAKICAEKGFVFEGTSQEDVLDRQIYYAYYGENEEREVGRKGKRGKGGGAQGEQREERGKKEAKEKQSSLEGSKGNEDAVVRRKRALFDEEQEDDGKAAMKKRAKCPHIRVAQPPKEPLQGMRRLGHL